MNKQKHVNCADSNELKGEWTYGAISAKSIVFGQKTHEYSEN